MRHRRKSISLIKKINLKNYLTSKNGQIYTALVTEVCCIHFRSVIFPENDCNKKFAAKSGSYLANEPLNQKSVLSIQQKRPQLSDATITVSIGPELMENKHFSHRGSKAFFSAFC